jgi:hypothetical protein
MRSLFQITRLWIFYLGVFYLLASCNNDPEEVCGNNPCEPCNFSAEVATLYNQLNEMYQANCVSCLEDFLDTWQAKYPPREAIPEEDRWLHELYRDVYTPHDLGAFTYMDTMNHPYYRVDMNQGFKYIIVNDNFDYGSAVPPSDNRDITGFRPVVNADGAEILYLRPEYDLALSCFLDYSGVPFVARTGPLNLTREELEKRELFLENYFQLSKVLRGTPTQAGNRIEDYVFGYFRTETFPWISSIDKTSDSTATVRLLISTIDWETKVVKRDTWEFVDSKLKWDGAAL